MLVIYYTLNEILGFFSVIIGTFVGGWLLQKLNKSENKKLGIK